jgi:hypothetical protein
MDSPQSAVTSWYSSTTGQDSSPKEANWIGWVEESIDFFTCDEEVGKRVLEKALSLHQAPVKPPGPPILDYAKQHDEFLESLLHEQTTSAKGITDDLTMIRPSLSMSSSQSFGSSQTSSLHSRVADIDDLKAFSPGLMRPLKLHRRKTKNARVMERDEKPLTRGSPRKVMPLMDRADSPVTVCLEDLEQADLPSPSSYLHPQCCLQKDKGKGDPVGSKLSASTADECLMKLQQKMELLTSVTLGKDEKGKKGNAEMKRKNAKISEETCTYTETRSMIVLRMGFLSMQYGVLLRWDNKVTGKITMVVLRKLCHDSFYPKGKVTTKAVETSQQQQQQPRPTHDVVFENHAILDRPHGLEVALFEPPFLVPQPQVFSPALLTVVVECAKGLSSRLAWTVKLHLADKTEKVHLRWNPGTGLFEPLSEDVMEWQIPALAFWDMQLDVELYEHKRLSRRAHRRKIWMATMPLSLASLQARTPIESEHPVKINLKVPHMPGASIVLSMSYQSDYAGWIFRELEARRTEEAKHTILMSPLPTRRIVTTADEEKDYPMMWDLFCCAY